MQPSARQQELERLYNARRGHVPHISISDDSHHITEAIGSYYGSPSDEGMSKHDPRPLSFISSPSENYENRHGINFDAKRGSPPRTPLARKASNERVPTSPGDGSTSPKSVKKMGSIMEDMNGQVSPPPLSRQSSSETATQHFPLNDIDYESSPAAVAQELSNLQAIRRMSMNVDMADPDLPSFGGSFNGVPTQAPSHSADEDDPSKLFWVPARLHPELAPKEFKTFVEDRVDRIRRRSGGEDSLLPDGIERSGSGSSSLRRKKSMLSHSINTRGDYQDGSERLERKRSRGLHGESQGGVTNLSEMESLVNDPEELRRRMSLETTRRSQDSGVEVAASEDLPILPPGGPALKRSTRTTYRRGSLRKGERVPFSKRALTRQGETDTEDSPVPSPVTPIASEPLLGLTRVQTEPTPPPSEPRDRDHDHDPNGRRPSARRRLGLQTSHSNDDLPGTAARERASPPPVPQLPPQHQRQTPSQPQSQSQSQPQSQSQTQPQSQPQQPAQTEPPPTSQPRPRPSLDEEPLGQRHPHAPKQKQFHSRIASQGRTTAQLPGYNNSNPLPHIVETLPDGTKVPVNSLAAQQPQQQFPERKSSHEHSRAQRGGAHMRPVPGRERASPSSTLDDISSHPSPLPGSGSTRTDALTMVPTFEEKKSDKKDGGRKSSWKWILGNDDEEKDRRSSKEERRSTEDTGSVKAAKGGKHSKANDKARLDVLQNSIDGTLPARGRESIVLNREEIKLEDERKKESKKSTKPTREEKEAKEPGLLSAIFGGKKKSSDTDLKEKKRKSDRTLSPDVPPRILKPDIDYNWTRFSILEERAIYRMAHIKLANPRRALYSQVLLSNFMYSYLAKVQMMHPQMQIPASPQQKAAQQRKKEEEEKKAQQPAEYSQYQRWQEQQARQESSSNSHSQPQHKRDRSGPDTSAGAPRSSHDHDDNGYESPSEDQHHSEWPDYRSSGSSYNQQFQQQQQQQQPQQQKEKHAKANGNSGGGDGYSVASTHDYLGYPRDQQGFGAQDGLWDDEKEGDLW